MSISLHAVTPPTTNPKPMQNAVKSLLNKASHAASCWCHTVAGTRVSSLQASAASLPCQNPMTRGPLKYTYLKGTLIRSWMVCTFGS